MSDIRTLEIPKWGLSMEEGTIAQWLIQEGEHFSKGQDICEIETTKIVNVLEAPFEGRLRKILANNGDTLIVGGCIAVCAELEVTDAEIDAFVQSLTGQTGEVADSDRETKTVATPPQTVTQPESSVQTVDSTAVVAQKNPAKTGSSGVMPGVYSIPLALQGYLQSEAVFATPHAHKLAHKHNVNLMQVLGSGRQARISVRDIQTAVIAAGGQWPDIRQHASAKVVKSTADDRQLAATPVARRLAKQWGINLHDCRASGSRGRICKEDVEAVYARENSNAGLSGSGHPHIAAPAAFAAPVVTAIAMNGMRKAIAGRLQSAKRNAPHFRLVADFNVDAIQALRSQINATVPHLKLSINDMLIKAAAAALVKVPQVNVQFDEENQQILQFENADISIAVAIENGLITPIVKAANKKSLAEISIEMLDLVTRAKTGKLSPDEFQGGSFSISNLGMLGIKQFDAIINPPQGAILALGASEPRAVVEGGELVIRHMLTATLSCDHRVIDGALGAKFLATLKQFVENPALILV